MAWAWSDFPLTVGDAATAEQMRVVASAIAERLALVDLTDTAVDDIIDTGDDDLVAGNETLAAQLNTLRNAVESCLSRYYDAANTVYTLENLLSDAGAPGTYWTRIPARITEGAADYAAVVASQKTPLYIEHLNEIVDAVKQLKRIRFVGSGTIQYANHVAYYIKTYVPTDWPTAIQNAYNDTAGNPIVTGNSTSRVAGRSCDATDWTYYYNYYRVRYAMGSLYLPIDWDIEPRWADLDPASLTYANQAIVVELAGAVDEFQGTPQLAIRSGSGLAAPATLPGGGSLIGSVAWSNGKKTVSGAGIVLPKATGDQQAVYLQEDDYNFADVDTYPGLYGNQFSSRHIGIDAAGSVEAFADVTNLVYP